MVCSVFLSTAPFLGSVGPSISLPSGAYNSRFMKIVLTGVLFGNQRSSQG